MTTVSTIEIHQLPDADTPLDGTEYLPISQDDDTKKVAVSEIGGGGTEGAVVFEGVVTPAALAAGENNNWAPDLTDASRVNVTPVATSEITGIVAPADDGRMLILTNIAGVDLILRDQSSSSTAANRFAMNGDIIVPPGASVFLMYVTAVSRWSKMI